jgi:SAM-dependent methyltransferase
MQMRRVLTLPMSGELLSLRIRGRAERSPSVATRPPRTLRNDRLYPHWSSSRYCVLAGLRHALTQTIDDHVQPRATVLDFGCGDRPYEPLVTARGAAYLGVDLPGTPRVDRFVDEEGRIDARDCSVDVVLSTQVLEHVDDPSAYLREAHRVLRPRGILILSTHGYWRYHPNPKDLWRWTGEGLRKQIEECGFEVLTMRGVLNLGAAGLQLFQDYLLSRLPSRFGAVTAIVMQRLVGLVDQVPGRADERDDAAVFVVVARRVNV